MKFVRAALLTAVLALCVWIAFPNLFQADMALQNFGIVPTPAPSTAPAPTPNYDEIAPNAPVETAPLPTHTIEPVPTEDAAEESADYVMDLWLDASPNMAGLSTGRKRQYGEWIGGFFYRANANKQRVSEQEGLIYSFLDLVYGKEVAGQGAVRVLRPCAESILDRKTVDEIAAEYGMDSNALIRDTLTYSVLTNNAEDYSDFFAGLFDASGNLKPGTLSNSSFKITKHYFSLNQSGQNNRTVRTGPSKDEETWNWRRETESEEALNAASDALDSAMDAYKRRMGSAETSAADVHQDDYLYYSFRALDPARLNLMLIDTLSLPEMDSYRDDYAACVAAKAQQNGGDLAVGFLTVQLDYAGTISSLGGRILENGLIWGYEDYAFQNKKRDSNTYAIVQPMPRSLLMLAVGPGQRVDDYMRKLTAVLDEEMAGGRLSGTRGSLSPIESKTLFEPIEAYVYDGAAFSAPEFGFDYRGTVMRYTDVVSLQTDALGALSQMLNQNDDPLCFAVEEEPQETASYLYRQEQGAQVIEHEVPVVTLDLSRPVAITLSLGEADLESMGITDEQYGVAVHIQRALFTDSFAVEDIAVLNREGLLDLSEDSAIINDQAYIGEDGMIYKYHLVSGEEAGLSLPLSRPVTKNGDIVFVLEAQTRDVPTPGYYWVTLDMFSRPLADLDSSIWNPIEAWMAADDGSSMADPSSNPAVLSHAPSWDYEPNNRMLKNASDTDKRVGGDWTIAEIRGVPNGAGRSIHHAWGNGESSPSIPPVFRVFQLNRLSTAIRSGLLNRTGQIDSTPFLTRHFILHVPGAMEGGER